MNCTTSYWTDHSRERQLWCAVIDRAVQDVPLVEVAGEKTGKVLVAHEATQSCGVGAEVAAVDPVASMQAVGNERLGEVAARARSQVASAGGGRDVTKHRFLEPCTNDPSAFVASFSASGAAAPFIPLAMLQIIPFAFAMCPKIWPIVLTSLVGWNLYLSSGTCAAAFVR